MECWGMVQGLGRHTSGSFLPVPPKAQVGAGEAKSWAIWRPTLKFLKSSANSATLTNLYGLLASCQYCCSAKPQHPESAAANRATANIHPKDLAFLCISCKLRLCLNVHVSQGHQTLSQYLA